MLLPRRCALQGHHLSLENRDYEILEFVKADGRKRKRGAMLLRELTSAQLGAPPGRAGKPPTGAARGTPRPTPDAAAVAHSPMPGTPSDLATRGTEGEDDDEAGADGGTRTPAVMEDMSPWATPAGGGAGPRCPSLPLPGRASPCAGRGTVVAA